MTTGLLLLAAALCLTFYNMWDEWRAGREADQVLAQLFSGSEFDADGGRQEDGSVPDYMLNPEMEMPTVTIDGVKYIGMLTIPALDRSLPVISEWDDLKLKTAPCRYAGSVYLDNLIIAGHNYRSHFGKLRSLSVDDEIIFTDVDGNYFYYQVTDMELLADTAVEDMEAEAENWDLTLFTCTVSGGERVTVRCRKWEREAG